MTLWTDYVECLVTERRHIWFVCQNWIFTFPKMEILIFFSPLHFFRGEEDIRWKITIKCDDVCVISKWGIHLCKAFSCLGGTSVEINLKDIEMKVHLWRFQRHCMQFLCFISFSVKLSSFYLQYLIHTLILLKTNMCISEIKMQQMEKKKSPWHF